MSDREPLEAAAGAGNFHRQQEGNLMQAFQACRAELAALRAAQAEPVAWCHGIMWSANPRAQSEQIIKVTRYPQPEHGFTIPIHHQAQAAPVTQPAPAAQPLSEGRPASMPMQDTVADDMDEVAKQYAHKLAMNLECLVLECPPSARFFDEANTTLGEYRSAMNKIHERECPTHMGEPLLKGQGADSTSKAHAIYEKWTGKHS